MPLLTPRIWDSPPLPELGEGPGGEGHHQQNMRRQAVWGIA
jgi:hypothetical protein